MRLTENTSRLSNSPYAMGSAFLLGVLFGLGVLGLALAQISDDGFFFLGFVGVCALLFLIVTPIAGILAIISLRRREAALKLAIGSLSLSVLLILAFGYLAFRILTEPIRMFS